MACTTVVVKASCAPWPAVNLAASASATCWALPTSTPSLALVTTDRTAPWELTLRTPLTGLTVTDPACLVTHSPILAASTVGAVGAPSFSPTVTQAAFSCSVAVKVLPSAVMVTGAMTIALA